MADPVLLADWRLVFCGRDKGLPDVNFARFCNGGAKGRRLSLKDPFHFRQRFLQCARHLKPAEIVGREIEHAHVVFLDRALFVISIADPRVRCEEGPVVFSYERYPNLIWCGAREMSEVTLHRDTGLPKNIEQLLIVAMVFVEKNRENIRRHLGVGTLIESLLQLILRARHTLQPGRTQYHEP